MAPKTKFEPPNLENATPAMLIDEMGKLSIVENYAKKLRGYYKQAYFAQKGIICEDMINGESIVGEGDTFIGTTTRSDPERFDQTRFAADHPMLFEEYKVSKGQLTTRFIVKEGANKPLAEDLLELMKQELDLE